MNRQRTAYDTMYALARHLLSQEHSVVLDSPCAWPRIVTEGMRIAASHGATYRYIECQIHDLDLLDTRLTNRPRLRSHRRSLSLPPPDLGNTPQDGQTLYKSWASRTHHPPTPHLQLNTQNPLPNLLREVDTYLTQ